MEKKVKITLEGGFHNCNPVNVLVSATDFEGLKSGSDSLQDILTDGQQTRLMRHFCGVRGCTCGGYRRASWRVVGGR